MKMINDNTKNYLQEGGPGMIHDHRKPDRPIPPHERKAMMHFEYDENDWALMKTIFGDEDTAYAAVEIIKGAPAEIQILAMQLINIIEEVA